LYEMTKIWLAQTNFWANSRYPTIIMTKPQFQKHAKSLETSNARFGMVGKGIHCLWVLQQAGLDGVGWGKFGSPKPQLLSQFKISNHHNDQTTASKTCQITWYMQCMIWNGWEGNPRDPCLAAGWFGRCGMRKIWLAHANFRANSRYPTIIMTKPQLQKHAKSLDTSNASWLWMAGKGVHCLWVLQQTGLDFVNWRKFGLSKPFFIISMLKGWTGYAHFYKPQSMSMRQTYHSSFFVALLSLRIQQRIEMLVQWPFDVSLSWFLVFCL
jgi:hypothetical protein